MPTIRTFALGAGAGLLSLAVFVQGALPWLTPESRDRRVTRAVRTDLGEVRWMWYPVAEYTPLEARGREVYIREGCWYCHSQYVRPVAGEDVRWGPVSEAGEYHFDRPHLLSTRRIGPDLSRVGGKYADGWHYAHHWDPRLVVPDSNMPAFRWLFHVVAVRVVRTGAGPALDLPPEISRHFTLAPAPEIPVYPNAAGLAFADPGGRAGPIPGRPVLDLAHFKGAPPAFAEIRLVVPSADLVGLVAYVQRLGTGRGAWRDAFEPQTVGFSGLEAPRTAPQLERGREVYRRRCQGCHGDGGDGNGPVAPFLDPRPRDFTAAVFKFRSTPSGALPTDGDLYRTITRGLRGTAMPSWHELREAERLAVIPYLKTFAPRAWQEPPEAPVPVLEPPPPGVALVGRGREVYRSAKCWECHGDEGRGDGPSAGQLKTDDGHPIRPTDLTRGVLKGGASVRDVYRTLTTGLNGTPMPSYADTLTDDERWALAYHVLALSAFTDARSGERLTVDAPTRAALDAPGVGAEAGSALDPERGRGGRAEARERHRYRHGLRGGPRE